MGMDFDRHMRESAEAVAARRDTLFRETPLDTIQRYALGTAWALQPSRIGYLPALGRRYFEDLFARSRELPDPTQGHGRAGLCGIARDVSPPVLIEGYRRGLYPFAHFGPLKWMSPAERCVLAFRDFHLSRRLRSRLRQQRHRVTFDRAFDRVIKACAGRRQRMLHLTWITPRIMRAYADLHDAGHAHSFEVWNAGGELVGGGYGVAVGGAFTIESQFTAESHCSKIGFAVLNWHLAHWGFALNDNKGATQNCVDMGFRVVPRAEFLGALAQAVRAPDRSGRWDVEAGLAEVAAWNPAADEVRVPEAPPLVPTPPTAAPVQTRRAATLSLLPVLDNSTLGLGEALLTVL